MGFPFSPCVVRAVDSHPGPFASSPPRRLARGRGLAPETECKKGGEGSYVVTEGRDRVPLRPTKTEAGLYQRFPTGATFTVQREEVASRRVPWLGGVAAPPVRQRRPPSVCGPSASWVWAGVKGRRCHSRVPSDSAPSSARSA